MVNYCSVLGCSKKSSVENRVTLFKCPEQNLKSWSRFVKRNVAKFTSKVIYVCSDHFTREDFENWQAYSLGFHNKLILKKNAVPTVWTNVEQQVKLSRPSFHQTKDGGPNYKDETKLRSAFRKREVNRILEEYDRKNSITNNTEAEDTEAIQGQSTVTSGASHSATAAAETVDQRSTGDEAGTSGCTSTPEQSSTCPVTSTNGLFSPSSNSAAEVRTEVKLEIQNSSTLCSSGTESCSETEDSLSSRVVFRKDQSQSIVSNPGVVFTKGQSLVLTPVQQCAVFETPSELSPLMNPGSVFTKGKSLVLTPVQQCGMFETPSRLNPFINTTPGVQMQTSSGVQVQTSSGVQVQRSSGVQVQKLSGVQVQKSSGVQVQKFSAKTFSVGTQTSGLTRVKGCQTNSVKYHGLQLISPDSPQTTDQGCDPVFPPEIQLIGLLPSHTMDTMQQ